MGSRRLWLGMAAVRALAALVMVAGLAFASVGRTAAQVEDDTFTAQSYDWSITWDDRDWVVEDEVNEDDYDAVTLYAEEVGAFAYIEGYAGFDGDPAACLEDAIAAIEENRDLSDVAEADDLDLPRAPRAAEAAVYTYIFETDEGDLLEIAEYTECRTLVEGEAVFELALRTLVDAYPDAVPLFEDLLAGLEVDEAGVAADDEEDDRRGTDEEDDDGRDVTLGDDDEEEEGGGRAPADSGIDGNAYESPTYGYTFEWDEEVWEADAGDELVDYSEGIYDGLDSLPLRGDFGSLYIEGKVAYEGDPETCLEEEADLLADEEGVEDFELLEDENGDPITGETADGNFFGVYEVVYVDPDDRDAEPFDLIDYVECRELVAGEAVLVITFITGLPDEFAANFPLVQEVINTIELADGGARDDEEEEQEDSRRTDDEEEEETGAAGGVEGNAYESPTYGYGIEWDDRVWEVEDETSRRGVDTLVLTSEFGVFTLAGTEEFAGDPADCFDALEADADGQFDRLTLVEDEDGPARSSDDVSALGLYTARIDGVSGFVYLQCMGGPFGDVTVSITFASTSSDPQAALAAVSELVGTITDPR